jgi:hypothetical protein
MIVGVLLLDAPDAVNARTNAPSRRKQQPAM